MSFPNPTCPCQACKIHRNATRQRPTEYDPVDPYAKDLATLRAANTTPAVTLDAAEREQLGVYADGVARLRSEN
jgi:hypothetical protein